MTPAQTDARLALFSGIAMDMFLSDQHSLSPRTDSRLSPDWILRGYITAEDVIWHPFSWLEIGERVFYGFVAESASQPGVFIAAIRGTGTPPEWLIDGKFAQVSHPIGGHAEAGFWGVYSNMRYQPMNLAGAPDKAVGPGIAEVVGEGTLTVIGHSLGAALATYLALDLAKDQAMGGQVRARIFASPRPGDQCFADAFATHVTDATAYARARDAVPEVPQGFGYLPLHCLQIIGASTAQSIIKDSLACEHHIVSYASSLDYTAANWSKFPACDESLVACILGPAIFALSS